MSWTVMAGFCDEHEAPFTEFKQISEKKFTEGLVYHPKAWRLHRNNAIHKYVSYTYISANGL